MLISKLKSCRFGLLFSGLLILLLTSFTTSAQTKQKIIVLGDSLSAAYGMSPQQGWVNILAGYVAQKNPEYEVLNASISGDTTESGLNRLPSVISNNQPDINIMIIALGANDGLRGLDSSIIKSNLGSMIKLCQDNNIRVLLVGMQMPPNYGESYTKSIQKVYQELSVEYKVRQIPFMLANVATNPKLIQEDGLHPTQDAQPYIYRNILMGLRPMLRDDLIILK